MAELGKENFETRKEKQIHNFVLPPKDYLDLFRQSPEYKTALKRRVKECRVRNLELTIAEIEADFSHCVTKDNSAYKDALWAFYRRQPLGFSHELYRQNKQLDMFLSKLQRYWGLYHQAQAADNAQVSLELDRARSEAHTDAGQYLAKIRQVPNFYIGRTIIQFLSEANEQYMAERGKDRPYIYRQ